VSAEHAPGRTFGRVADAYRRTRPPYTAAAVDHAIARLGLDSGATVLDLGAGTGKLTQALHGRVEHVVAVEPDDEMRAAGGGEALAGAAEAIPLEDGSVDGVFVGEAFHWFDHERALPELARVTRPGGGVAVLARSWGEQEQPGLLPRPFSDELDDVWARFHTGREFRDWTAGFEGPDRFEETVSISGRDLVDLHLTGSTPASIPAEEREAIASRAYPLMADAYDLRVVTAVYWRLLP
jgi:SAM-dependent methyltransferase